MSNGQMLAIAFFGSIFASAGMIWLLETGEANALKKSLDRCSSDCEMLDYDASTVRDGDCWCIIDRVPTRWSDIASIPDR